MRCDGCGKFARSRQLANVLLNGIVRRLHIGCGHFDSGPRFLVVALRESEDGDE